MGYSASLLDEWIYYFSGSGKNNKPTRQLSILEMNIWNCLKDFREFAASYQAQVRRVAEQQKDYQDLDASRKKGYMMWLDEQISRALDVYWAPLSQAATQYASPPYQAYLAKPNHLLNDPKSQTQIISYLKKVNDLVGLKGNDRITVNNIVLFFDEDTHIRRPPYTKMAFISTPFRVFNSGASQIEEKLTGIAHELGHYLFWRLGDFNQTGEKQAQVISTIVDRLKKNTQHTEAEVRFVKAWVEEMFADFIGAKIAGVAFVRTCQQRLIRRHKTSSSLGENDHEHPPDILRPLISMYVLETDQHPGKSKEQRRAATIKTWKNFFQNDFSTDMSEMKIVDFADDENEEDIKKSPEELSQVILDTVDIFFGEFPITNKQSLFFPDLSASADASVLVTKAGQIHKTVMPEYSQPTPEILDLLLDPVGLEAGEASHSHVFKIAGRSNHRSGEKFTFSHSHP